MIDGGIANPIYYARFKFITSCATTKQPRKHVSTLSGTVKALKIRQIMCAKSCSRQPKEIWGVAGGVRLRGKTKRRRTRRTRKRKDHRRVRPQSLPLSPAVRRLVDVGLGISCKPSSLDAQLSCKNIGEYACIDHEISD